jgi:redox-sensing transcriptional repressor
VGDTARRRIPEATVARLPVYYRALLEAAEHDVATISSERLAELAGVNAAKVRKDLSYLGSYGTRGVGYEVDFLTHQMSRELGLTDDWPVVIVGAGNLGQALANYAGFDERGFPVSAIVDVDPRKVGAVVNGVTVRHLDALPELVRPGGSIGVIATPPTAAQEVADQLVAAGVTAILNFAPTVLSVPRGVTLRKVDLAVELQILSFYERRRTSGGARARMGARPGDDVPVTA